jgi:hypothetical protein
MRLPGHLGYDLAYNAAQRQRMAADPGELVPPPRDFRPILVGESNPYGSSREFALYPAPENSAGWRLCSLILRLNRRAYLRGYDRRNLCPGPWSMPLARAGAEEIRKEAAGRAVVMLGSKVAAAFGLGFAPFTAQTLGEGDRQFRAIILPHPSGLNRMWQELGAIDRARALLKIEGVLLHEDNP